MKKILKLDYLFKILDLLFVLFLAGVATTFSPSDSFSVDDDPEAVGGIFGGPPMEGGGA